MYVKRSLLFAVVLFATSSSLSTDCSAQDNPAYLKSRTRPVIPYKHATLAAPPGMVYIPGGAVTIKYSQSSTDTNAKKKVSLSSFYIDKTEVTNQQYRMFTQWVMDSIAVVQYLKDDKYFLDNPIKDAEKDNNIAKTTGMPSPTSPTTTDSATAAMVKPVDSISSGVTTTPGTATTANLTTTVTPTTTDSFRKRRINWAAVNHKEIFESNDEEIKAKIAPMFDPISGKVRKELYVFPFTYLKATGTNVGVKIGEYATERINIYPDEQVWFKDINNSQVEILVENYFTQPPYDDYPVVGVTWKQARAFAYWRSISNPDFAYIAEYLRYYRLQYSLPSEAQWVYAAGKDMKSLAEAQKEDEAIAREDSIANAELNAGIAADMAAAAPPTDSATAAGSTAATTSAAPVDSASTSPSVANTDNATDNTEKKSKKKSKKDNGSDEKVVVKKKEKGTVDRDRDGTLLVNFKQGEGDYTEDGGNFTLPVMSYAPNEYGVYNMVGNVSEWVLDAYSPSTFAFVSDVNPVLLYDADSTDADAMKRKVIRGGSFVSNAKALSPFSRDFEIQETAHCFIGFRCVMSAPDILNRAVSTRRKNTVTEKKAK
jgi:formylglycine-generating enzyme required for sulfatase activity